MDYENMLEKAIKELPKELKESFRFEIPKIRGHVQGNKTIISNFLQIASAIGRKPEHVLKFLLKELATPGDIKKTFLILGRKVSASAINQKIEQYVKEFVICNECLRPDTKTTKEKGIIFLKCLACGSKRPLKI